MENILVTNIGKARCAAGSGAAELLGRELERLGVRRPLLVSDAGVAALPKYEKTLSQLKAAGLEPVVYDKVTPNPKDYEVMEGTELYKARGCDGVVGIGGGSSMDCAKGISAMARHEGKIMDYGRSTPNRRFFIRGREPLFCVPTTTGTGSELSPHAVITNTERNNRKSDVQDPIFYNDMFFLDPEFACTQSYETLRDTGIDALSHMIDSYTNRMMLTVQSPLHEAMGMKCCSLIAGKLKRAIDSKGQDLEAVLAMQWAATLGGAMLDLNGSAIHGLSGVLQKYRHDMTHGVSVGIIMPACMEYNLSTDYKKFAAIARALGAHTEGASEREQAELAVTTVEKLLAEIGFPKFADFRFTSEEIREMAEASVGNSMLPLNAREITTAEEIASIYNRAAREVR